MPPNLSAADREATLPTANHHQTYLGGPIMATQHNTTNILISSPHPSDNLLAIANTLRFIEGVLQEKTAPATLVF